MENILISDENLDEAIRSFAEHFGIDEERVREMFARARVDEEDANG